MATRKLYELTDEHRGQFEPWAQRWIANALNTKPMDETDREATRVAIAGMYRAAKLSPPERVIFCESPMSGAIAACVASGVWWLREHPEKHVELFGRQLTEEDLASALHQAVAHAVAHGLHTVVHRRPLLPGAQAPQAPAAAEGEAATEAATWAATEAATGAATEAATEAATGAATRAATGAATGAATEAATRAATGAATEAATRAATGAVASFLVRCLSGWYKFDDGGNQWSGYVAYISFFRHIAKLDLPEYDGWQHYEAAAIHSGPRFMHQRFCIVSDRPEVIRVDEQNRPHREDGPFTSWRDGWALFAWHGVTVPAQVILAPGSLTGAQIRDEQNAEIRRVMLERFTPERFMRDIGATVVHEDECGKLLRADLEDDEPLMMVEVVNSTPEPDGHHKLYMLRVDPNAYGGLKTARAAVASTWRKPDGSLAFKTPAQYTPLVET